MHSPLYSVHPYTRKTEREREREREDWLRLWLSIIRRSLTISTLQRCLSRIRVSSNHCLHPVPRKGIVSCKFVTRAQACLRRVQVARARSIYRMVLAGVAPPPRRHTLITSECFAKLHPVAPLGAAELRPLIRASSRRHAPYSSLNLRLYLWPYGSRSSDLVVRNFVVQQKENGPKSPRIERDRIEMKVLVANERRVEDARGSAVESRLNLGAWNVISRGRARDEQLQRHAINRMQRCPACNWILCIRWKVNKRARSRWKLAIANFAKYLALYSWLPFVSICTFVFDSLFCAFSMSSRHFRVIFRWNRQTLILTLCTLNFISISVPATFKFFVWNLL